MTTPKALLKRAEAAEADASQWHQGSGIHAGACEAMAETHVERGTPADLVAAELWVKAAEEEAAFLKESSGVFGSPRKWAKSRSGQATKAAKAASRKAGLKTFPFDL